MTYLGSVTKSSLTNFQLVGAQFSNSSVVLYRLALKVLPVSSGLTSIVENVLVQYIGPKNCLLIDSNYSGLSSNLSWTAIDNKAILSDPFIAAINGLLRQKYGNLLGSNPTIASLAEALPYYQVVYQVDSTSYSFIVLYDYFQNRILQGNLTTYKAVSTSSQSSSGVQSASNSVQTSKSQVQASNTYTPSSSANAFFNGNAAAATTVTTAAGSSNAASNPQQTAVTSIVATPTPTEIATTTAATAPSTPSTNTASASSASSTSTSSSSSSSTIASSVITSNSTSSSSSTSTPAPVLPILTNPSSTSTSSSASQSTSYQQIANFQSSS
jgi:hypothetical protein